MSTAGPAGSVVVETLTSLNARVDEASCGTSFFFTLASVTAAPGCASTWTVLSWSVNVTEVLLVVRAHPSGTDTVQPALSWYGTNWVLSGLSPGGLDSAGKGCSDGTAASVGDAVWLRADGEVDGNVTGDPVNVVDTPQPTSSAIPVIRVAAVAIQRRIVRSFLGSAWVRSSKVYAARDERSMRRSRSPGISHPTLMKRCDTALREVAGADPACGRRDQDGPSRSPRPRAGGLRGRCRRRRRGRAAPGAVRGLRRDRSGRDAAGEGWVGRLPRAACQGPVGAGAHVDGSRRRRGSDPGSRRRGRRLPREAFLVRRAPRAT